MITDRDGGCLHACRQIAPGSGRPTDGADLEDLVSHLYLCEGLSTYRIGAVTGMDRQRVGRMLARTGVPVKPKGAGRRRPVDQDRAALDEAMAKLYTESGLSSGEISAITGIDQRTVRDRLHGRGVQMRTKGRLNREDRATVDANALIRLYVRDGLSASDTGKLLGVSGQIVLRAAHDQGLPVRVGGPEPRHGPGEIELVAALYADPLVQHALARHNIPRRPADGPIWKRFPVPVPVSGELAGELYVACGIAVRHIELLTGHPAKTILRLLRAQEITRRPAGGRSPFMRRWRAGPHTTSPRRADFAAAEARRHGESRPKPPGRPRRSRARAQPTPPSPGMPDADLVRTFPAQQRRAAIRADR